MKHFSTIYMFVRFFSCLNFNSNAQSITGQIVEGENHQLPYADVLISREEFHLATASDEEGRYRFDKIPKGTFVLSVNYLGYQSVEKEITLTEDKVYIIDIAAAPWGAYSRDVFNQKLVILDLENPLYFKG